MGWWFGGGAKNNSMIWVFEWMRKNVISLILLFVGWIMIWKLFKHGDLALFVKVVENIYKRWSDHYWTWSYSNFNNKKVCQFWARIDQTNGAEASSIYEEGPVTSHSSTAFLKLMRPPSHPSRKTISWESNFKSFTKLFGQYVFLGKVINPPYSSPFLFNHPPKQKIKPLGICPPMFFGYFWGGLQAVATTHITVTSLLHSGPDSDLRVQQLAIWNFHGSLIEKMMDNCCHVFFWLLIFGWPFRYLLLLLSTHKKVR